MRRIAITAILVALVFAAAVVARAAGEQPEDESAVFQDFPTCPNGPVEVMAPANEMPAETLPPGAEAFDTLWVAPTEMAAFSAVDVPDGFSFLVACVDIGDGDRRLIDGDGVLLPTAKGIS